MRQAFRPGRFTSASILFLIGSVAYATKGGRPSTNPPAYAAFSKPLTQTEQCYHALRRLTFGSKPGDYEAISRIGLHRWIENELHPEKTPENPVLEKELLPLQALRMGIRDTYTHYPPPQMIAAVARGKGPLPDDPELRAIVVRLADRYLQRKGEAQTADAVAPADQVENSNELPDLDLKVKLSSLLTPDQITILQSGKPDEKAQVLAGIPPEKRLDFAWAVRPQQRRQLLALAPVELRRELMLSVAPQNVVASDLAEGKLLRAVYSTHQLQELLVDFWYNHFNVFLNKGADRYLVPTYEREAIRPHVFGKFYDLLLGTAKSPAMLFYLDNWQSVSPEAAEHQARLNPKAAKRGLNENYGRELLELHTLGVDGGYTQKDVIEVARCFTGWTIARPRQGGEFEYNDKVHDKGRKVVLGHVIPPGGGMEDGLKVLSILAHHPSTARFISLKLAQRFVADNPPPSLVARMANTFTKSDGDLRQVVRTMITAPEFWSQGAYNAKIKTPFEMVVSALRATNAEVSSAFAAANEPQRLGEPLYRKIEPTGYSSANAEWVSSAGLLERMNFALALAHNRVPGVKISLPELQAEG
ncbi:MAG: DUF1800 domain-containing protein, partial [Acidobacteriaceae bacterium]|nr:DUF1800 domain-containing protein [Acidobacteriaceae bacterium]